MNLICPECHATEGCEVRRTTDKRWIVIGSDDVKEEIERIQYYYTVRCYGCYAEFDEDHPFALDFIETVEAKYLQ
jgi:hypothetical protein